MIKYEEVWPQNSCYVPKYLLRLCKALEDRPTSHCSSKGYCAKS